NPVDARLSVVVRDILQKPVDRVVRVRALIHVFGGPMTRLLRRHLLERPVALEPPAHVLVHEDESIPREDRSRPQPAGIIVRPVGTDAVGRPHDQKRIGLARRGVLRHIDRRKQLRAVPHRNPKLVLRVIRPDPLFRLCAFLYVAAAAARRGKPRASAQARQHRRRNRNSLPRHHDSLPRNSAPANASEQYLHPPPRTSLLPPGTFPCLVPPHSP